MSSDTDKYINESLMENYHKRKTLMKKNIKQSTIIK